MPTPDPASFLYLLQARQGSVPVTTPRVVANTALPKQCKDEETDVDGRCLSCGSEDLSLVPLVASDGSTRHVCSAVSCTDGRYACGG